MLNIYTNITGEMQRNAARNIDQGIAGMEVQEQDETGAGGAESSAGRRGCWYASKPNGYTR